MIVAGCDVGSLTGKAVILKDGDILSYSIVPTTPKPERTARNAMDKVLQKTNLSLVLYNIPPCTGVELPWTVVEDLADIENFVAIKDSSGDFKYFSALIEKVGAKLREMMSWVSKA